MFLLKPLLALILILYLFQQKSSTPFDYTIFFHFHLNWFWALSAYSLSFIICVWRWKVIIQKYGVQGSYLHFTAVSWIGAFFNSFLPGSYGGDLVKIFYLHHDPALHRSKILATIIVDRIVGIFGFIFLFNLFMIATWMKTGWNPQFFIIYSSHLTLLFSTLLFFFIIWKRILSSHHLIKLFSYLPHKKGEQFINFIDQLFELFLDKKLILKTLAITLFSQFFILLSFWFLITPFITSSLTFISFMTYICIGFFSMILPLTPQGIGVSHLTFDHLFSLQGQEHGAFLYNLFFLLTLFYNLIGVIPYLLLKSNLTYFKTNFFRLSRKPKLS